jgi:hypothetical protein
MRGADAVAVRDGGKPLHGRAKQTAECLGFCLAQLGILGGDMRYRAVMLAKLLTG